MERKTPKGWLAPAAAILSLVTCYGTLAAVALLGALGMGIALNEAVWAGAIVVFAALTVAALALRARRHGRWGAFLIAGAGFVFIAFAMYVCYSRAVELLGFALLVVGTFLDWRGARRGG